MENKALADLEHALASDKIKVDDFFDIPNKLRFLQANKFKIAKTVESMVETTKWRLENFPVRVDPAVTELLVPHPPHRTPAPFTSAAGTSSTGRSWPSTSGSSRPAPTRTTPSRRPWWSSWSS
jgi:hypothetical protein